MPSEVYADVNWDDLIPNFEEALSVNEWANNGSVFVRDVLPFIKRARPRVAKTNSLFYAITLICLQDRLPDEEVVVNKGLDPLVRAEILTLQEANQFREWFAKGTSNPIKHFSIDGTTYTMSTDTYRGFRDLGVRVVNPNRDGGKYPFYCLGSGCSAFGPDGRCYSKEICTWVPNQPEERDKL